MNISLSSFARCAGNKLLLKLLTMGVAGSIASAAPIPELASEVPAHSLLGRRPTIEAEASAATLARGVPDGTSETAASWTAASPCPAATAHYGFAQDGELLLVLAGVSNGSIVNAFRYYDSTNGSWAVLTAVPLGSEGPATAYLNDQIYLVDGMGGANLIRTYSLATNSWSAGAARPGVANSFGAAAGVYNNKVYVVGGGNTPSNVVSIYDITSNTWSSGPAAPAVVQFAGYKQIGQYLYIIGGFTATAANSNLSMRLDMASNTWSVGPSFTMQRADFALAASGTTIYALGGDTTGGSNADASAEVDQLDTALWPGGAWTVSPNTLPVARYANSAGFFTTARAGGEIWSTGGVASGSIYLTEHTYRPQPRAATCSDYTITQSAGTLVAGSTDTGNHCDDCVTTVALPFLVSFYNQTYSSIRVDSNGNAQFVNGFSSINNTSLPTAYLGAAILPFYDDLRTDGTNQGIYTLIEGTAPNRIFDIEWRAAAFSSGSAVTDFELRLFEGSSKYEVIYGNTTGAFTGTIGVQSDSTGNLFTQFGSASSAVPAAGTRLIFTPGCCPPITFSGVLGSNSTTYPGSSGMQTGRLSRIGSDSACGTAKAYPGTVDATSRAYDAYAFTNSGAATCLTFTVNTACTGTSFIYPVAYSTSFNPADISANYLGDAGTSPNPTSSFSVNVAAGATIYLVVSEVTPGAGCSGYNVTVEGFKCPPVRTNAVSRKTHGGGAGNFDLILPTFGTPGVESRVGGATNDYQLLVNFPATITVTGSPQAQVTAGSAVVGNGGVSNGGAVSVSGSTVIVPLTSVANAQNLTLTLRGVADSYGAAGDITVPIKFLIGDGSGDGTVNSADATQTRNQSGQTVTPLNFRLDFNIDGSINSADATNVRSRSGQFIP